MTTGMAWPRMTMFFIALRELGVFAKITLLAKFVLWPAHASKSAVVLRIFTRSVKSLVVRFLSSRKAPSSTFLWFCLRVLN